MSVAAHGRSWRVRKHAPAAEPFDAAAVIARALNRQTLADVAPTQVAPVAAEVAPEPVAGLDASAAPAIEADAPPVAEPAFAGVGLTTRVPFDTPTGDDPLAAELLAVGNSLIYDLVRKVGAPGWDEIVVELPPGEAPDFAMRADDLWQPWRPSAHTHGALEVFRALLQEIDPGVGYDVVVRPQEMIVCRWPHRAWDVREHLTQPGPAPTATATGKHRPKRHRFGPR